jgi:hypothetical protein
MVELRISAPKLTPLQFTILALFILVLIAFLISIVITLRRLRKTYWHSAQSKNARARVGAQGPLGHASPGLLRWTLAECWKVIFHTRGLGCYRGPQGTSWPVSEVPSTLWGSVYSHWLILFWTNWASFKMAIIIFQLLKGSCNWVFFPARTSSWVFRDSLHLLPFTKIFLSSLVNLLGGNEMGGEGWRELPLSKIGLVKDLSACICSCWLVRSFRLTLDLIYLCYIFLSPR